MTTNLPLLSTALSTVYFYGLVVPVLLWAVVKWLGVGDWSVVEALGTYGYAMSVFIPIGLACLIPVGLLRWVFVGGGTLSSGWFLCVAFSVHLTSVFARRLTFALEPRTYIPYWQM